MKSTKQVIRPTERTVTVEGLTDVMFDRYAGDNKTELRPGQKVYLLEDGVTLGLPALNILSFLSAQNTESAPKRLLDKRKYKDFANAVRSFVMIAPSMIPFIRDKAPIKIEAIDDNRGDGPSGVYIHRSVARLKDGIPNPKVRPVLPLPWALTFRLSIYPNDEFSEEQLVNLFIRGGLAIGFGTWRGVYGKFDVTEWA